MNVDFVIIGHGLAGALSAYELERRGYSFLVIDQNKPVTSSRIAAGMYTAVNPKRMTLAWNYEAFIPRAIETYRQMEKMLNVKLLHQTNIYNAFGSVKEVNDFSMRLENKNFASLCNTQVKEHPVINSPYGVIEIKQSGWLDIGLMLETQKQHLLRSGRFLIDEIDWLILNQLTDGKWQYNDITTSNIICCEGYERRKNPYWNYITPHSTKGDELIIEAPDLPETYIWKKGIYIVPLGNKIFRVGSTYQLQYTTEMPDEDGRKQLCDKLDAMLNCSYTVIRHEAAVRPTSHDRKPIAGRHPERSGMYILNGLGTKGVIYAPNMAEALLNEIETGRGIMHDAHVDRYKKYYCSTPKRT